MSAAASQDVVLLCAAGMLVSAFLMVGLKALFMAIRLFAVQSLLLSLVALAMGLGTHRRHLLVTAALVLALKTAVIPWFLMHVVQRAGIHREIQPILNVPSSLLVCMGLTVVGYRVSTGMAGGTDVRHHVLAASLSTLLIGLFMMVTRRKAVSQMLGLLMVENAVFLLALGATSGMPLVLELGISFDVMLAVLVLGMLVGRIVERFESMDVSRLSRLRG